jgi:hypothetical protein
MKFAILRSETGRQNCAAPLGDLSEVIGEFGFFDDEKSDLCSSQSAQGSGSVA